MIYQNRTPGLLTSEAERLGRITVGTELGWGEAVNREGVAYGRVLAAAIRHDQLRVRIEPIGHLPPAPSEDRRSSPRSVT